MHFGPLESASQRALQKRLQNTNFHAKCKNKRSSEWLLFWLLPFHNTEITKIILKRVTIINYISPRFRNFAEYNVAGGT